MYEEAPGFRLGPRVAREMTCRATFARPYHGVSTRARWVLAAYRDGHKRLSEDATEDAIGGGTAPSSGFIALYLAMQLCQKVAVYGRAVQVDSIKPRLETRTRLRCQRLKLESHKLLSRFAFKCNLRRYNMV